MESNQSHISALEAEIDQLKQKLFESNEIIEAIREGSVDALVLNKDGEPHIYSIESADYTYRILIEKFGEGALSISYDGLILYCNNYFAAMIGQPANKIVGTYLKNYVADFEQLETLAADLENGPVKGDLLLVSEFRKVHAYVSMTDLQPNVAAIGVVVTDLTEKRKNDEELETSRFELETKVSELHATNTNLEQFIHVISHDLKEPIRKLLTYTNFVVDRPGSEFSDSDKRSLNIINSSAVRLNSLVDDLVKYSYSAVKNETVSVDLNKVVKEVSEDLELLIKENDATIVCDVLPEIMGSKVQMRQLVANLLSNALKYRKADVAPIIKITTRIVSDNAFNREYTKYHKIQFSDNGIGMKASHLSKIFTIFQRLHMRNEYSGNGIGLAICKKIIENHSGHVDVQSVEGVGSIFNIYLPVEA